MTRGFVRWPTCWGEPVLPGWKKSKPGLRFHSNSQRPLQICTEKKHKEAKGLQRRPSFYILNGSLTTFPTLWREPSEHVIWPTLFKTSPNSETALIVWEEKVIWDFSLTTVCQADLLAAGTSRQLVPCREPQAAGLHSLKDSLLPELPLVLHFCVQHLLRLPGCVPRTVWDMGYGNPVLRGLPVQWEI